MFALLLTACFVYGDDVPSHYNSPPEITYADAGCYWDEYEYDDVWYFEADVDDYDGWDDVVAVYADVYDLRTDEWVDGFDLYPEGKYTWYSDWLGSSTYLYCGYPDYVVDFTAVDTLEDTDVIQVYPWIE